MSPPRARVLPEAGPVTEPTLRDILDRGLALRTRALTPEQADRRRLNDERCRRLQEVGVPAPASGTFGKGVPDKKAKT